jgi:hypothetical protein
MIMKELARRWNEHKARVGAGSAAAAAATPSAGGGIIDDDEVEILGVVITNANRGGGGSSISAARALQDKVSAPADEGVMEGLVRNLAGLTVWG